MIKGTIQKNIKQLIRLCIINMSLKHKKKVIQEEIGKSTLIRKDFTHFSQKPSERMEHLLKIGY